MVCQGEVQVCPGGEHRVDTGQAPVRLCWGYLLALVLLFLDLIKALAVDTLCSGGASFQAANANFNTTGHTVTVVAFIKLVD